MVLIWNHDASLTHRYHVIDAGDGGYRILTSLPLQEGTTGMVLRLLPGNSRDDCLAQPVMVAWCRPRDGFETGAEGESGYEAGLRVF